MNINALFDYALTRDQTLRFGYSQNNSVRGNHGIGAYDLPERAFTSDQNSVHVSRPRGRPDRAAHVHQHADDDDVAEFRVNDRRSRRRRSSCRTRSTAAARSRPAACNGKNLTFASDLDYVRGIHSWRGGVQIYADWYRANLNNNYLGTYIFSSLAAYEAGTPLLYTRSVGDPQLNFFHARIGRVLSGRHPGQERA